MSLSQSGIDALLNGTGDDQGAPSSGPTPNAPKPTPPKRVDSAAGVARILALTVPVTVKLAERPMSVESILEIAIGTIVEFDVPFDSELILEVANHPIGTGLAVKIGENFGLRVSRIGTVPERISAMGASARQRVR